MIKELTAPTGYQRSTDPINVAAESVEYGKGVELDGGRVVKKNITTEIPPTPPTVDKPELPTHMGKVKPQPPQTPLVWFADRKSVV